MPHIDFHSNKNKLIAAAVTILITAVTVVILILVKHFPPDPPIPERGVEVTLGNTDFGMGDNMMPAQSENTTAAPQPAPATSQESVATQSTEETVSIPKKTEKTKPTEKTTTTPTETKQPEKPKEPEINKNALFPGSRNSSSNAGSNSNSGSSGNTYGSGNMGKPNGNPNSTNYNGNGGGGDSYYLAGRNVVNKSRPSENRSIEGWIEVVIMVNREGKVVEANVDKQSSSAVNSLKAEAVAAAKRTTFKPDPSAPEVQKGRIRYNYINR
jgi:TonB family protein